MSWFCNFISIINRAFKQKQAAALVKNTKLVRETLRKLMIMGFIRGFYIIDSNSIRVYIKVDQQNNSSVKVIQAISRPGKRVYGKYKNLNRISALANTSLANGLILSTPKGLLTYKEAVITRTGGELLLLII